MRVNKKPGIISYLPDAFALGVFTAAIFGIGCGIASLAPTLRNHVAAATLGLVLIQFGPRHGIVAIAKPVLAIGGLAYQLFKAGDAIEDQSSIYFFRGLLIGLVADRPNDFIGGLMGFAFACKEYIFDNVRFNNG